MSIKEIKKILSKIPSELVEIAPIDFYKHLLRVNGFSFTSASIKLNDKLFSYWLHHMVQPDNIDNITDTLKTSKTMEDFVEKFNSLEGVKKIHVKKTHPHFTLRITEPLSFGEVLSGMMNVPVPKKKRKAPAKKA